MNTTAQQTEQKHTPERIRVAQDADGFWTCRKAVSGSQEYIRADVVEDMLAVLKVALPLVERLASSSPTQPANVVRRNQAVKDRDAIRAAIAKAEGR